MSTRRPYAPIPPRALPPVTDYALVGDGHSAALVSSEGSVDFWCPERFDAPSVFLRVLDVGKGGYFATAPRGAHRVEVGYEELTNAHRTTFVTWDARVDVTTFMPHASAGHADAERRRILRLVECREGSMDITVELAPRFDYARAGATLEASSERVLARPQTADATAGARLALASTLPLEVDEDRAVGTFRLQAGERHALVLDFDRGDGAAVGDPLGIVDAALDRERRHWREWASRVTYEGPYEDHVRRSMLALKLLQHAQTGAFVAAPTFGLPERPAGPRNWDYRYTWLRDSAFIVMAFETVGLKEEAVEFRRWLARIVKRDSPDRLQPMYRVDGERELPEVRLDHLEGYRGARPVRIGNGAADQLQLDAYGDVMICFHRAPVIWREEGEDLWRALVGIVDEAIGRWREEDASIWEVDEDRQYTFSKGMAWLAIERGIEVARKYGFDAPEERWRRASAEVRRWLDEEGYVAGKGFVQDPRHHVADAANVLFPLFGILDPEDPRVAETVDRVRRDLVSHGLAHRHLLVVDDGREGAFLAVNFWLANDLALRGRVEEARAFMDAALNVASPLGLLPEEADAVTREGVGNHPLGLSHYSLALAAYAIREAEDGRQGLPRLSRSEASRAA